MCLSVPARVIGVKDSNAEVEVHGERRQVFLAVGPVRIGDWVLLHGGIVLAVLDDVTAAETLELLNRGIGERNGKTR